MSLSAGDKAECKEIAREIIQEVLRVHTTNCPHHASYLIGKARIVGIISGVIIASAVASAVTSGTVVTIIMRLLKV